MNDKQPKRPPRSSRNITKDFYTGIFISSFKTYTSTRDLEEREREEARLQYEFNQSNLKLDKLVVKYHSDLTSIMQSYSKVSNQLCELKDKLKETRSGLVTCQQLLPCKRDELKKLWLELIECKESLELLDQVENVLKINDIIKNSIDKKNYLNATKNLVEASNLLKTSLKNVGALKEIRNELDTRCDQLYDALIEELNKHVYVKTLTNLFQETFNNNDKNYKNKCFFNNPLVNKNIATKMSVIDILNPSFIQNTVISKKKLSDFTSEMNLELGNELNVIDSDKNPQRFIASLIECLKLLDKTEDAVQIVKDRIETELMNCVKRTGREIINLPAYKLNKKNENNQIHVLDLNLSCTLRSNSILINPKHKAYLLEDFCNLIFQQFREVAQIHENLLIPLFKKNEKQNEIDNTKKSKKLSLYTMLDVWNKIQQVLNIVTDLYLDVNDASNQNQINENDKLSNNELINLDSSSNTNKILDLNSYFVKKRVGLSAAVQAGNQLINNKNFLNNIQSMGYGLTGSHNKKNSLFRFDWSSHSISLNSYLSEQKQIQQKELNKKEDNLQKRSFDSDDSENLVNINDDQQIKNQDYIICQPTCENIIVLFMPMMRFINEIDEKLNLESNNHCLLYTQLKSFSNNFIKVQITNDIVRILSYSLKCLNTFTNFNDTNRLKMLNSNRPLLLSTVIIIQCINDLRQLMHKLPINCDDFLNMINDVLNSYKENCLTIFKAIVEKEDEKKIISANWAKDEDINRFLKSLPNWLMLSKYNLNSNIMNDSLSFKDRNFKGSNSTFNFERFEESSEDVYLRNVRESQILINNLAQDTLIPNNEVLSEIDQLKNLAQLQESMEHLGLEILKIVTSLTDQSTQSIYEDIEFSPLNQETIKSIKKLSEDFIDLSEICLLVLHLEIRVHCFYFLLPMLSQNSFCVNLDNQDIDQEVLELNKDLALIDEQLTNYLQSYKLKYIFEGVSSLVATILINNITSIKRINDNGVKRMCKNIFSIQKQLTAITLNREVSLDNCRQYYEMFLNNSSPEDLFKTIVDKGILFNENEYLNAIVLMQRNLGIKDNFRFEEAKRKLFEILRKAN